MKKRLNKKAQSRILIVILLILVAIILVAIVWNFVIPLIREKGGQIETGTILSSFEVQEIILFETGESKVTVNRKSGGGEITGLKFVFYDEENNNYIETKEDDLLKELETRVYSFSPVPEPEIGKINAVSVVPVFGNNLGAEFKSDVDKVSEIPSGLVSWWRFNEDADDFVDDNDCEIVGSVDGALIGNADCGNDSSLDIADEIAISFWIKTNEAVGEIISKGENYKVSLSSGGNVMFSYDSQSGSQTYNSLSFDADLIDNKWHHIVVTDLNFYIDGKASGIIDFSGSITNSDSVLIGQGFNGAIDELMLFEKNLNIEQAQGLYNNQKDNFL